MTTTNPQPTIQEQARAIAARAPRSDPAAERAWALCILSCPLAVSVEGYCARPGDTSCAYFPALLEAERPPVVFPRPVLVVRAPVERWWRRVIRAMKGASR